TAFAEGADEQFPAAVVAAVVHADQPVDRPALPHDRVEGLAEPAHAVVDDDDRGDRGGLRASRADGGRMGTVVGRRVRAGHDPGGGDGIGTPLSRSPAEIRHSSTLLPVCPSGTGIVTPPRRCSPPGWCRVSTFAEQRTAARYHGRPSARFAFDATALTL